jgi:hypothetical protein
MERANRTEHYDNSDHPIDAIDSWAVNTIKHLRAIEAKKSEELTEKIRAAGIPVGNIVRTASSINNKTARRGGSHSRRWRS